MSHKTTKEENLRKKLEIECVGDINEMIKNDGFKDLMFITESYHDKQIVHIAQSIFQTKQINTSLKCILIAGLSKINQTSYIFTFLKITYIHTQTNNQAIVLFQKTITKTQKNVSKIVHRAVVKQHLQLG